jgi:RIO kinase 1
MRQKKLLDMLDLEDPEFETYPPDKPRNLHQPIVQPKRLESFPEIPEQDELSPEIQFTYRASHHEREWIVSALGGYFTDHVIYDVLHQVRGGKEANVYCCSTNPTLGTDLLAAKIYRPRMFRNLKNDALYKVGRSVLDQDGKPVRDQRSQRAIQKKTRIGVEIQITSWIEHEYHALQVLHQVGAKVPRPIAQDRNVILMEYIGEEHNPAPTLNTVTLSPVEARSLFDLLIENIHLMLSHNFIHADLSAYNVLYWNGDVRIIDFPQVVDPFRNPNGFAILERDVKRICQYFNPYNITADYREVTADLWRGYLGTEDVPLEPAAMSHSP